MTVVAATKYVSLADMAVLAEAGVDVVGENRAQDLEAKHAEYGDAFRWHFIGHLQSNKVKVVNRICELVHSLDSDSAARRLEVPALVQVNLAGEASKAGVEPERARRRTSATTCAGSRRCRPAGDLARGSRPGSPRLRELAERARPRGALDGHDAGLRVAAEEGATLRTRWLDPVSRLDLRPQWRSAISGTARSSTSASPRRTTTGTTRTATPPRRASSRATASGRTSAA